MRSFDLYSGDQRRRMRLNDFVARMGERCIQGFGEKTLRKRENLEDPGVDRRLI
jgi:hypothetical protein